MMNQLYLLPNEVQRKIQSYLYFSYETSKSIQIVNYIIKNYSSILMKEFTSVFFDRYSTLYYRLIQFLMINPDIKTHVERSINPYIYEFLYQPFQDDVVLKQVKNIIQKMSMIQKQKAYNYIMFGRELISFSPIQ